MHDCACFVLCSKVASLKIAFSTKKMVVEFGVFKKMRNFASQSRKRLLASGHNGVL